MRTFAKSQIRYSKSQRMGIFAFIGLIISFEIGAFFLNRTSESDSQIEIPPELLELNFTSNSTKPFLNSSESSSLEKFNPNALTAEDWQNLGFSEKQSATILKYKYSLGGNFTSKEQIRNCYVISDAKFEELEPFIELSSVHPNASSKNQFQFESRNEYSIKEKPKIRYQKFNPNEYSLEDWQRIGFSEKQAATILKYKRSLGGEFTNINQIQACFVISEDKFKEMKPYLIFSDSSEKIEPTSSKVEIKPKDKWTKFNPNHLSKEEWMELGFTEKQANTILNYKQSLGGNIKNAEILKNCYAISDDKFVEIEPFLVFD